MSSTVYRRSRNTRRQCACAPVFCIRDVSAPTPAGSFAANVRRVFAAKTRIRFNNIPPAKTAALEGGGIVFDMPMHHGIRELLNGRLVPVLDGWHVPNLDHYIASARLDRVQLFVDRYVRRRREIEGEQKRTLQERFSALVDF